MSVASLKVNGRVHKVDADPKCPLLYVLRDHLEMINPRFGCGVGQCGACTVLMDNRAVRSCQLPMANAVGKEIVTLEGLGTLQRPHPLQKAFIDAQAAQCGYCSNGMIMAAKVLLDRNRNPSEDEIKDALSDQLCRCGVHNRVVRAIRHAAEELAP